jgi:hypothetical protein
MEEKVDKYFTIPNILKITSLVTYLYLTIYSDYYKFVSSYPEDFIKLILGIAAIITTITILNENFVNKRLALKRLALIYNVLVGSMFTNLFYKIALLEFYKADLASLGPWIKIRRIWTPKEYIEMFLELIKDNPKIDPTKISAKFLDQVSRSSSVGDLQRFKQILIEQQSSVMMSQGSLDPTIVLKYLLITVGTVVTLYFTYQMSLLLFNQDNVNKAMQASIKQEAKALETLKDNTIAVTDKLNDGLINLGKALKKTHEDCQGLKAAVEEMKNLTGNAMKEMVPVLKCSNALNVITQAFGLETLESGDREVINKALESLKTYFTISLKMVNEHIAKARLVADGNVDALFVATNNPEAFQRSYLAGLGEAVAKGTVSGKK